MKILFLDFDGVVRVPLDEALTVGSVDFCPERLRWVAELCQRLGARVVVTSDWRLWTDRPGVEELIGEHLAEHLHADWRTEIEGHPPRHVEVARWLECHRGEVSGFVVLEDVAQHFEGASDGMVERLVMTDPRHGLRPRDVMRAEAVLALKGWSG